MQRFLRAAAHFARSEHGGVSPIMILMLIPLCGMMALAGEASFWYATSRALQNAADSAALAAATNNNTTYNDEAVAVAGQYGFVNGSGATIATTKVMCPSDTSGTDCYQVTASLNMPLYLTSVVGYQGDLTGANGQRLKTITAVAVARPVRTGAGACMTALGSDEKTGGITFGGSQDARTEGCIYRANVPIVCNGIQTPPADGVYYAGDQVGGNKSCAPPGEDHGDQEAAKDPFTKLDDSPDPIPEDTCSKYEYKQGNKYPAANDISTQWATDTQVICGDARLTGDVDITGTNKRLVIFNGGLDLNGKTIKTSGDGGLTVIFAKGKTDPANSVYPSVTGTGTFDVAAPSVTSSTKGAAVIQDGDYAGFKNVDWNLTGNATFSVTGLVYAPAATLTINGAINKSSSGDACMAIVSLGIRISGTGQIFENPVNADECAKAGLTPPPLPAQRQRLVK